MPEIWEVLLDLFVTLIFWFPKYQFFWFLCHILTTNQYFVFIPIDFFQYIFCCVILAWIISPLSVWAILSVILWQCLLVILMTNLRSCISHCLWTIIFMNYFGNTHFYVIVSQYFLYVCAPRKWITIHASFVLWWCCLPVLVIIISCS